MVSVIVPVFKAEKYINQCIEKIINQTYKDIEIILIDDGSPDNCPQICDDWAKKDNRIKVIHKQNGGVSSSRNAGLEASTGEWIVFVDSDDIVDEGMIESLYCEEIDFSIGGFIIESFHTKEKVLEKAYRGSITNEILANILSSLIFQSPWAKMYRKSLITEKFNEEMSNGEDTLFVMHYIKNCKSINIVEKILYYYIKRKNSLTTKGSNAMCECYTTLLNELFNNHEDIFKNQQVLKTWFNTFSFALISLSSSDIESNKKLSICKEYIDSNIHIFENYSPKSLNHKIIFYLIKKRAIKRILFFIKILIKH